MCFCPSQLQQARSFLKSRRAAGFLRFSKVKGQCARWAVWVPRFRKLVAGVKFIQRQNAGSDGSDIALVFSPLSQRTSTYMDPNGGRHCGTHQTWP